MTARHILTCAQTLDGGGVERAMLRLATRWAAAGRRVTIVIGCADGPLADELPDGAETIVLGHRGYGALARAIPAIVEDRAPDAVFCPGNHYTGVAAWTRLRLGRRCPPTIAKLSNTLHRADHGPVARAVYRAWLRAHPRFCDAVVAMSAAMAAEAARHLHLPPDRIAVIANPPAMPRADALPVALPTGRYLLGVGRLAAQKRWDRAIVALAAIADRDIPLVILGEGPERATLEALAARVGVAQRLLLPGHAGDPLPVMAGAAALVLTSDFEGVPGVLREALSVGTPVVTTDSSVAIPEIVTTPALGSIVPRDDAAALAAAIDHWLAPGRARPAPVSAGGDPAADYLALFDVLSAAS
ncbi:glycosyltransferase [Sphingomonas sp.]|uniref:glycosyltransferase n=1 Tax=Sphingomonas sp. TaxID=28214 RepID=UPI002DD61E99|nr:glycosyltransferase [Sphingomonas sp.]